jgi:hypothetical protein
VNSTFAFISTLDFIYRVAVMVMIKPTTSTIHVIGQFRSAVFVESMKAVVVKWGFFLVMVLLFGIITFIKQTTKNTAPD